LYWLNNRLQLQENELKINRILKIEKFLAFIVFTGVLVTPTVLATIQFDGQASHMDIFAASLLLYAVRYV